MNDIQEILFLVRENNAILKELLSITRRVNDPDYVMEQDINDFIMNVVANLLANGIEKNKH